MANKKIKSQSEIINRLNILISKKYNGIDAKAAECLGISRTSISQYKSGNNTPSIESIMQISQRAGVSTDWLLGLIPEENMEGSINVSNIRSYTGLSNKAIEKLHEYKSLEEHFDEIEGTEVAEASKALSLPFILSNLIEDEAALMRISEYINTGHYVISVNGEKLIHRDLQDFPVIAFGEDNEQNELYINLFKEYKLKQIQKTLDTLSNAALSNLEKQSFGNSKYYQPKKVTPPIKKTKKGVK